MRQVDLRVEQIGAERVHWTVRQWLDLLGQIDHEPKRRLAAQIWHRWS